MTAKGLRKCRAVDSEENQDRVSLAAHQPLEIALAIPTFPQPRSRPPWKSGNPKAGFPLSHSDFPVQQNQKRKEINPSPKSCPSGSSQDWNMLTRDYSNARQ